MFFSPWADLHQWNGRACEEDSKQQEGLAPPNVWQRSDKRSAEEGQQALRGQREKREQERMWVACLAHKSPKKAVSSRIMSVNNDNQKRRDSSFCPLKTVQVRLERFTSALVSYSDSNWKTSQCRVHSVNQSVIKKTAHVLCKDYNIERCLWENWHFYQLQHIKPGSPKRLPWPRGWAHSWGMCAGEMSGVIPAE